MNLEWAIVIGVAIALPVLLVVLSIKQVLLFRRTKKVTAGFVLALLWLGLFVSGLVRSLSQLS
jgi:predicted branched-subunit amino acid permease